MRLLTILCLCVACAFGSAANAADGRILKVLPQFLDTNGVTSLTPSLYDRDAYQALLSRSPSKRSGLRFAVQWKASVPASEPLKLRVEIRGATGKDLPKETSLEKDVRQPNHFSHWSYLILSKEDYKALGEVTSWRVTLWDGDKLLGEQKSFLW
jgi:hypothetical protein